MPWKECHVMDERLRFEATIIRLKREYPGSGSPENS